VQKQNTSGRISLEIASGSVDVLDTPNSAAAFANLAASRVQMPASSKRGLFLKARAWCLPRFPIPTTTTLYTLFVLTEGLSET